MLSLCSLCTFDWYQIYYLVAVTPHFLTHHGFLQRANEVWIPNLPYVHLIDCLCRYPAHHVTFLQQQKTLNDLHHSWFYVSWGSTIWFLDFEILVFNKMSFKTGSVPTLQRSSAIKTKKWRFEVQSQVLPWLATVSINILWQQLIWLLRSWNSALDQENSPEPVYTMCNKSSAVDAQSSANVFLIIRSRSPRTGLDRETPHAGSSRILLLASLAVRQTQTLRPGAGFPLYLETLYASSRSTTSFQFQQHEVYRFYE